MDVVVLSDRRYMPNGPPSDMSETYISNVMLEDGLVVEALQSIGLNAARRAWCDSEVNWSTVKCALFRTTWDYFDRWGEFSAWLKTNRELTTFLNASAILQWNLDKHYLKDLESHNISIVPTEVVSRQSGVSLLDVVKMKNWSDVVIKPAIAGAAVDTFHVDMNGSVEQISPDPSCNEDSESLWQKLLMKQDMLVQPFLSDVKESGEISLIWIDGEVTHAVRKQAKTGDFRVQDDHGGTVHPFVPSPSQIALAQAIMESCCEFCLQQGWDAPLYARVDLMRGPDGQLLLSELEMVEPELWFRHCPNAAQVMAHAVKRRLEETPPDASREGSTNRRQV